eukprot:gene16991-biopygen7631
MILLALKAAESSDSLVIKADPAKRTSSGLCSVVLSHASDFPDSLGFVDEIESEEGSHHDFVGVEGCRIIRFACNQSESSKTTLESAQPGEPLEAVCAAQQPSALESVSGYTPRGIRPPPAGCRTEEHGIPRGAPSLSPVQPPRLACAQECEAPTRDRRWDGMEGPPPRRASAPVMRAPGGELNGASERRAARRRQGLVLKPSSLVSENLGPGFT